MDYVECSLEHLIDAGCGVCVWGSFWHVWCSCAVINQFWCNVYCKIKQILPIYFPFEAQIILICDFKKCPLMKHHTIEANIFTAAAQRIALNWKTPNGQAGLYCEKFHWHKCRLVHFLLDIYFVATLARYVSQFDTTYTDMSFFQRNLGISIIWWAWRMHIKQPINEISRAQNVK